MAKSNGATHDIAAQLEALRKDIGLLATTVGQLLADEGHGASESLTAKIAAMKERGDEMLSGAGEKVKESTEQARAAIETNPLTSVLVAAGVGYVIGFLSRRK